MKTKVLLIIVFVFELCFGQVWHQTYPNLKESVYGLRAYVELEDGFFCGNVCRNNNFCLVKISKEGEFLFYKEYNLPKQTFFHEIKKISEERFLVTGTADAHSTLLIIDEFGEIIKSNIWVPEGYLISYLHNVVKNNDSTYTALGSTINLQNREYFFLVKFNENLELIWHKFYSGQDYSGTSLTKDNEDNYFIAGPIHRTWNLKTVVTKTDKNGNILWQKEYLDYPICGYYEVIFTSKETCLIGGFSRHNNNAGPDYPAMLNIDKNGNVVWFKEFLEQGEDFSKDGWIYNLWETENNEYVNLVRIDGWEQTEKFCILKTDSLGDLIYKKTYNIKGMIKGIKTEDKGVLIGGGEMTDDGNFHGSPWAFKAFLDSNEIIAPDPDPDPDPDPVIVEKLKLMQNYPNPFNSETKIEYEIPNDSYVEINIYNLSGKKIKVLCNNHEKTGSHIVKWNGLNDSNKKVNSGLYLYQLKCEKGAICKKLVLVK